MIDAETGLPLKTWWYRVDPLRLEGEIQAVDEEEALATSMQEALDDAMDAIAGGTWELRETEALDG